MKVIAVLVLELPFFARLELIRILLASMSVNPVVNQILPIPLATIVMGLIQIEMV